MSKFNRCCSMTVHDQERQLHQYVHKLELHQCKALHQHNVLITNDSVQMALTFSGAMFDHRCLMTTGTIQIILDAALELWTIVLTM